MFIFGSEAAAAGEGVFYLNPLFTLFVIFATIFIFVKFCGWAKKCALSGGAKKFVFIMTAVGLVVFNVLYSMGNKAFEASHGYDLSMATIALASALVWVFVFAFALMAETK